MKRPILFVAFLLGATCGIASAQPEQAPEPPQTQEAKNKQKMEEVMRKAQDEAVNMMRMPEAERNAKIQLMQENALRMTLTQSGFPEKNLQEAVLDFIYAQNQSRVKVQETGSKVLRAMGDKPEVATDITPIFTDYLDAVETAKTQREEATKALDEEIEFSKKPRLKALLTIYGIIGEAAWYTGDVQLIGQMGLAAMAPHLLKAVMVEQKAKPAE